MELCPKFMEVVMKIQILGVGCPKCKTLLANVEAVVQELGLKVEIEKVTEIQEIVSFGIMSTPGFAVNGKVLSAGKVLTTQQIKDLLSKVEE
jgi:small redox-active disulfide protein 2